MPRQHRIHRLPRVAGDEGGLDFSLLEESKDFACAAAERARRRRAALVPVQNLIHAPLFRLVGGLAIFQDRLVSPDLRLDGGEVQVRVHERVVQIEDNAVQHSS